MHDRDEIAEGDVGVEQMESPSRIGTRVGDLRAVQGGQFEHVRAARAEAARAVGLRLANPDRVGSRLGEAEQLDPGR